MKRIFDFCNLSATPVRLHFGRRILVILLLWAFPILSVVGQTPGIEEYRKFALNHEGDAARGMKLFNDSKLACSLCHSVDASANKAGPDLFAAGDAFGRRDLVEAVLKPSATIAPGYGTVMVATKTGDLFQGILKQSNAEEVKLMGATGELISIAVPDIKERSGTSVSLMPEGMQTALSLQEFTDLIDYLTSLKQSESTMTGSHGMPVDIPALSKPVTIRLFSTNVFTLPRGKAESGLSSFRQIPGAAQTFLVLHQKGMIWKLEKTSAGESKAIFADLTDDVFSDRGPNGLLDMTFHPKFRENRKYYLFYQIFESGKVISQIVEKEFSTDFKGDSGKPGRTILEIPSVAEDHSGGCLQFGPDGFLYIVMGDTGPHNDPNGHAQNLQLLLGKLMRIDVDGRDEGLGYSIPKDNPFRDKEDARPEIWAYGFRNPWRFCFDRANGNLWLADVGQDRVEEVDIVRRGKNYGWNIYEGYEPFSNQFRREGEVYTKPVFAYRRKYGNSITGGYVYRGNENSSFNGVYLCADYTSKRIFGLKLEEGILGSVREIGSVPQRIVSFSEDEAGGLYAVGYEGGIYKINFREAFYE